MNRRSFLQNTAFTMGAFTLAQHNILSALFQEPWKITMLRNDVGIFTERGGTIAFLLSKDGTVVVDSQFPDQSKHLIDELKKKSEQPFKLLINTHHHGDHSGGNISFKGLVEHVLAHENSKKNQENSARQNKSEDKQLYPDQTFTNTWCQKVGKEKICLHYFGAGHTNGDSFIHFQHANIVHCGDLVFNRRHPYVDRNAGANMRSWINVLDKALNKFNKKTIYVFGHAGTGYEVTGKADDLKVFRDYLGNVLKFVEGEIKAGKTKEEILKASAIPGSDQWKGDGIQRPLTAAWEELTVK
ncbi:MAG: MBL fold metallo-hydrolase [Chitinophagaceae bacterium]|nr:MBL fold metallo-hydrolase [Chitinophagaceae bacterium]HQV61176.1 MBL fold metallo-hydrolase [Chitinophagaceae bacterium]HQV86006.1 MBL fold metallo-hydrolase [Chitinophagaceae bacterium]HQX72509.1 MBL fold metallo-hydrolase [Chitinophagaceae bacterium]HQZ73470.1 MBL fold metallo-hydrolase [Chitinophagaceae bacterium]